MPETLRVTNQFGDKLDVEITKRTKNGIDTVVGYWDFKYCICCFNNMIYRTGFDCLGSCYNQQYKIKVSKNA